MYISFLYIPQACQPGLIHDKSRAFLTICGFSFQWHRCNNKTFVRSLQCNFTWIVHFDTGMLILILKYYRLVDAISDIS